MGGERKDPTSTKLYSDTVKLYDAMVLQATTEETSNGDYTVYRGYVTQLLDSLGIPRSTYSKIMNRLDGYGCINVLAPGSRGVPSVIVLVNHPKLADWTKEIEEKPLTGRADFATLVQKVGNIERSLGNVDLKKVLPNFEQRLQRIEQALGLTDKANGKDQDIAKRTQEA